MKYPMALPGNHLLSVTNLQQNPQQYGHPIKRVQSESDISACHDNHVCHSPHKSSDNLSPGFSKVAQVNPGISPLLTAPDLAGHAPPDSRKVTSGTAGKTPETKAASFDFQFVNSTNQVRKILTSLTGNNKSGDVEDVGNVGDVIVVTHPDNLSRDHLVHRLQITDGHPDLTPGKLFASDAQQVPGRSHQIYDSSVNVENKQEMPDISSLSSGKKNATEPEGSEKQTELHHSQSEESEATPLTLVLDVRALTGEELPRFNDLLDPDSPCLYDKVTGKKRPLGQHVKLLVLAAPEQLAAVGSDDRAPGADFWRRINRPGNTWQAEEQKESASAENETKSDSSQLLSRLPADASNHSKAITIDCHLHHDWRQLLFGGPGVENNGKFKHMPGKLAALSEHQPVILKGANWHDLAFEQTIRLLLARKQYVSNGQTIKLPKGVQFYRAEVTEQELAQWFQRFAMAPANIPDKPVVINQSNLSQWLNGITIDEQGYAQKNTSLPDQIEAGGTLTVTSPLSEDAWFQLLGTLNSIREHTGLKTSIFIAHPKDQPKSLQLDEKSLQLDEKSLQLDEKSLQLDKKSLQLDESRPSTKQICSELCRSKGLKVVTYQQETQAAQWLENHASKPQMFQVNAQTTLAQLFDNLYVISEKRAQFGRHPTDLQKALHEGDPVVLQGLETNPTLQQVLEPLCCGQPLLVNGVLQSFPNANITLLWPTSTKCSSPLWRQLLASADQCPEPDIWVSAALRNGIERDALPEKAINGLYQAFSTVPRDLSPAPGPLPVLTAELLANLIQAAGQARQLDQAESLEPVHWRKAINSVLTHGTRQNPAVRDFMKFACEQLLPDVDPSPWVDPDRLAAVLTDCQRLDRDTLEKQFWQLARAFHPGVFKQNRFIEELNLSFNSPYPRHNETLNALCALVAAHAPQKRRDVVACQLEVTPQALAACQHLPARPGRQIKRLEDALYSGWCIQPGAQQTRSALINHLANTCFDMARDASADEASRKHQIKTVLAKYLIWTGSKTAPLEALVDDLYRGHIGQQDREQRRLHRLKSRLAESPVIFLQGETGSGKSYFSAKMARAAGSSFIVSIGPATSEQSLMKRWAWQEGENGDRSMEQQKQILLQWAETVPSSDDDYVTLVLDEANLASPHLLTTLKGLWQQSPCVYIGGHPVKVSSKHRVILTGNPDHYAGRQLDPALKDKMQRVYYPPLDRPFLQDCVIEPALRQHLLPHMADQQARELAQQASNSVLALWQYYPELLPDHEFTPRDLTDICAWVGWYLNQPPPAPKHPETSVITREQIHALVLQGFRDVLNPELAENQKEALAALEIWFVARYPTDNTLVEQRTGHTLKLIGNYFRFETGIHKPEFDTSASAVSELVQQLGQDLSRCQQAWHSGVKHGGRQATLIEGPAGRGKDVTLQLLIDSFRQQVNNRRQSLPPVSSLNAGGCSWESLCSAIARARANGGILVISELNLIDSQYLEGELNDSLAGDAHPGFHLFATTNPPQYRGRKPLSPALKGRFRHLPIRKYHRDELTVIAQQALPDTPKGKAAAIQLTHWHCQLRRDLHQKNRALRPTSLDLLRLVGEIARSGDFSEQSLQHHTSRHYQLYLMAAQCTLEQLPDRTTKITTASAPIDRELCQWLSGTLSVNRPWLIRRGTTSSIYSDRHQITVPAYLETAAARLVVIRMVAEAQWRESGLSPDPDPDDDTLTQALYRRWQHLWFNRHFADTGVHADKAFPLTEAQALAMEANQSQVTEVDRLVSEQILNTANLRPAIWETLRDRIYHFARHYPVRHYHQQAPVELPVAFVLEDEANSENLSKSRTSPGKFIQNHPGCGALLLPALPLVGIGLLGHGIYKSIRKKSSTHKLDSSTYKLDFSTHRQLDKSTAYQSEKKLPTVTATRFFNSQHRPAMYRLSVNDINVKPDGNIEITRFQGISGFETVTPGTTWPEQGPILLAWAQIMASVTVKAKASDWLYLPSLNPDETIIALRTEPVATCQIEKDCYTGLHRVNFPELLKKQKIKIDFVVESKAPETSPDRQYTMVSGDTEALTAKRPDATCSTTIKMALDTLFDREMQADLPTDQQQLLWSISNPDSSPEKRIQAISAYCQAFNGQSNPKHHKNFFQFLIRSRQGACRHRAPVFVAMCRYFGIPARVVENDIHAFPEYSLDNGRSWQSQHLGGAAPVQVKYSETTFPPSAKTEERLSQRQNALLKNASPAQKEACAKALGLSMGKFNHAIENGLPLLTFDDSCKVPTNEDVIRKLWEAPNEACLAMGVELLIASDQLCNGEEYSAGNQLIVGHLEKPIMSLLCSGSVNTQLITEILDKLYSRMFNHGAENKVCWMGTIVSTLNQMFDQNDKVVPAEVKQQLSLHASESGWLTPQPDKYDLAVNYLGLLRHMKDVEELAPLATTCLQKWYDNWLGRDRYNDIIDYSDITNSGISNNHGGRSNYLESTIITRTLAPSWTDEPEGVPNIERLLTRNPAFPLFGAGKIAHRPMILMGSPDWNKTSKVIITNKLYQRYLQNHPEVAYLVDKNREYEHCCTEMINFSSYVREGSHSKINKTINRLFYAMCKFHFSEYKNLSTLNKLRSLSESKNDYQLVQMMNNTLLKFISELRISPEEQNRLDTIKNCFDQSIQLALSHYLYEMAYSKGGRLLVCWIKTQSSKDSTLLCGYHEPTSPEELAKMLSISHKNWDIDHYHLLNTHNATNGVVLGRSEITKIAKEFTNTVDVDSLNDEVCQHLEGC